MNNEGSLLAFAADQARTTKTYAAIAASIWGTYKQECVGGDVGAKGGLQFLIMDCEVKSSVFEDAIKLLLRPSMHNRMVSSMSQASVACCYAW